MCSPDRPQPGAPRCHCSHSRNNGGWWSTVMGKCRHGPIHPKFRTPKLHQQNAYQGSRIHRHVELAGGRVYLTSAQRLQHSNLACGRDSTCAKPKQGDPQFNYHSNRDRAITRGLDYQGHGHSDGEGNQTQRTSPEV
ncbi:hypothetical protein KC19_VG167400 [Ceratodon purpureus]|uniref:Uncharacterized protein n=1 Tax=Ceratodon purpureus TaxID=3225 RepID=A0A8T0HRZ5_CERPU|nr:hypothetical protein KC19_VG167400 [Ceratodon purpureus]